MQGDQRGGLAGELALAIPPTLVVLGALFFVEALTRQRFLFASLASSAFLIYRDPGHRMNSAGVMAVAHIIGVAIGLAAALLLGTGYWAAGVAMTTTIVALIILRAVHPPAISTALGFAFYSKQRDALGIFLIAVAMLAMLVALQRAAVWTLSRVEAQPTRVGEERQ